jgi:hypothetical protein
MALIRPTLSVALVLQWADDHFRRSGVYPTVNGGSVLAEPGETWLNIAAALRLGLRGLPGGDSLPGLLARERGRPHPGERPRLSEAQIVAWARRHHERTGRWPTAASGRVDGCGGETWPAINAALVRGLRGLPGDDSLAGLLARALGKRHPGRLPPLRVERILAWAELHRARTGQWPRERSGPVVDAPPPGETWQGIHSALHGGLRGLPGGTTLARLLAAHQNGAAAG